MPPGLGKTLLSPPQHHSDSPSPPTHTRSPPPGCQDATKAPPLGPAVPSKASPRWGRGRSSGPLPSPRGGGSPQDPPALPRPAPGQRRRLRAPRRAREVFFKLEFVIPARGRWVVRAGFPFFFPFLCMYFSPPLLYPTGTSRGRSAPLQHLPVTSGGENYYFF